MKKLCAIVIMLNVVTLMAEDTTAMLPPKLLNKDNTPIDVSTPANDYTITSGNASPAQCIMQAYTETTKDCLTSGMNHYIANYTDTILEVKYTINGIKDAQKFKVNAGEMYALYPNTRKAVDNVVIYKDGSNYKDSGQLKKVHFAAQQYPAGGFTVIFKNGKQQYTIGGYEFENYSKLATDNG